MKDSGESIDEKRLTTDELATAARRRERGTEAMAHPAEDRDRERVREPSTRDSELSPLFSNEEERDFREPVERHPDRVCRCAAPVSRTS